MMGKLYAATANAEAQIHGGEQFWLCNQPLLEYLPLSATYVFIIGSYSNTMSTPHQRDQAFRLAKTEPQKALKIARGITDPWYQSQALAAVTRFTDDNAQTIAKEASKSALKCKDEYQRCAVHAWIIAALAERDLLGEARDMLKLTLRNVPAISSLCSRAEALLLLLNAAASVDDNEERQVYDRLVRDCGTDKHWRCKRAVKDATAIIERARPPRPFFW